MKTSFVATILSVAAAASAQSISDLPGCALNCFIGPLQSDGCGSLTDYKCHCQQSSLIPKVQPCVQSKCPASAQQEVLDGVSALCAKYGVSLTIPTQEPTPEPTEEPEPTTYAPSTTAEPTTYAPPPSSSVIPYPPSNGTVTMSPPAPPPTGAAATAGFGGAVVLAAGVAAMAGL